MHYKDPYAWDKKGLKKAVTNLQELKNFLEDTIILGNHEDYGKLIEGFTNIDDELVSMLDEVNTNEYEGDDMRDGLRKITENFGGSSFGRDWKKVGDRVDKDNQVIDLFNMCVNLKSKTQIEEWKDAVRPRGY